MSPRALALAAALLASSAWSQSLSLQADSEELYANLPFVLSLSAADFDEAPQPAPPDLEIQGCEVTYLGVSPNVSQQIQIINGRRSEWKEVAFVYRWRVHPSAPGRYQVPPLTVAQGTKSATSRAAAFTVQAMRGTSDMIVRMTLPQRPVWAGETFDVAVEWLLNRDVESYEFVVPLFDSDAVSVAPGAGGAQTVAFSAGAATVELPMLRSSVAEAGQTYTRLRFPARVTALRPGTLDVSPVRVAARLEAGSVRDAFGFRRTRTALFQAQGERQRLTVRPLPQAGRPSGFVNAVGHGFAISVQASRSVVQVGDPIDLTITVRGDGDLEGLSLPPLGADGALPPALFSVPDAAPFGVVDAAANAKTFEVTVRVLSSDAREVPAIEFPYFDPTTGAYGKAASDPIALSVERGAVIGAADVSAAAPPAEVEQRTPSAPDSGSADPAVGVASLLGADMSLSSPEQTLERPWGAGGALFWLSGLYLAPLALAALRIGWLYTEGRRRRGRRVASAMRELKRALQSEAPAREAAPAIIKALRNLADALGMEALPRTALTEGLETTAFDPRRADQPLPGETVAAVASLAQKWARAASTAKAPAAARAATLLICAALLLPAELTDAADAGAQAEQERKPLAENALGDARRLYREALDEADRVRRTRLFAEAERRYRSIVGMHPDAPELLVDWGNAALGAGDFGRAVLGWRRALAADPGDERARRNLLWLRNRTPAWLPTPSSDGALASLLFWRNQLAAPQLYWAGAVAFAVAVVLWTPWSRRRTRLLRRVALIPLGMWAAVTAAAALGSLGKGAAVVLTDGAALRSADSLGAPPTLAHPLPAGAEVAVRETRDGWVRIALADGTTGWAAASAVAMVTP